MNKRELSRRVADTTGLSKGVVDQAMNAAFACLAEALTNREKVQLAGFGSFEVKPRKGRTVVNPRTKELMDIPGCNTITFKASKSIKAQLQKDI